MDKQSLISSLKERSGVDNVSERSFDEVATLFSSLFADDEKITDESWVIPVQVLKTMSGQTRHDVSEAIKSFKSQNEESQKAAVAAAVAAAKAEWEKTVPPSDPKPAESAPDIAKLISEQVQEQMKSVMGEDGEIGKLSKQFSDYLKAQAAKEKAATEADVRSQVRDYLIGRGVDEDDFALDYTLEKLSIGDNADIAVLRAQAEKDYESNYKKIHKGDGAKPFAGGGGGFQDSSKDFQDYMKAKQAAIEQEAKDAEELRKHMV